MAKKVKFPLDIGKDNDGNDILVREISELKKHYNAEKVTEYFLNGKLLTWLEDRYYDDEAEKVKKLSEMSDKDEAASKLPKVFGIESNGDIDIKKIEIRREKLEKLRAITSDDEILDNVDSVAFSQEDLSDLLDEGAEVVYLCGKSFSIPLSVKNVRYVGVNEPIVSISGTGDIIREDDGKVVEKEKGISVEQCRLSEDTEGMITETMKKINDGIVIEKYGNSGNSNKDYVPQDTANKSFDDFEIESHGDAVCLKKYNGTNTNVMVPNNVTKIGTAAFSMCKNIESILIQDRVTEIEAYAFMHCTNLKSLTFTKNITAINASCFYGCERLANVYIPYGVTVIDDNAFNGCYDLQNVNLPNTVCKIGKNVFDWCHQVKITYKNRIYGSEEINALYDAVNNIPQPRVKNINPNDFEIEINGNIVRLKKYKGRSEIVEIPDNVNVIGREAFYGCKTIKQIIIPEGVFEIGGWAFSGCESLEKINIPNGVTKIDYNTFGNCKKLKSVTLPTGLKEIKSGAFSGCDKFNLGVIYHGRTYALQQLDILYGYVNS